MMTYQFWMGVALSGLFHWFLLFVAAWRRERQPDSVKETIRLMQARNDIGTRQATWLRMIVEALEGQTEQAAKIVRFNEEFIQLARSKAEGGEP